MKTTPVDVDVVAFYRVVNRDTTVEEVSDRIRCAPRVGNMSDLVKVTKREVGKRTLGTLEVASHGSLGRLVLDIRHVLTALGKRGDELKPLKSLFSPQESDTWRLGVWGCDTASIPELTALAELLGVVVAGFNGGLQPVHFTSQGLDPKLTQPANGAVWVYPDGQKRGGSAFQKNTLEARGTTPKRKPMTYPPYDPMTIGPAKQLSFAESIAPLLLHFKPVLAAGMLAAPELRVPTRDAYFELLMGGRMLRIWLEQRLALGYWLSGDALAAITRVLKQAGVTLPPDYPDAGATSGARRTTSD